MSAPALTVYLQGLTTISADQANTFMQNGNTASDLRSFVGTTGMYVFIAGTDAVDDGNAGFFGWVSIAPGPDDDLNIIIPGGSGGAWVRITLLVGTPTPTVKTFQIRGNVSGSPASQPHLLRDSDGGGRRAAKEAHQQSRSMQDSAHGSLHGYTDAERLDYWDMHDWLRPNSRYMDICFRRDIQCE